MGSRGRNFSAKSTGQISYRRRLSIIISRIINLIKISVVASLLGVIIFRKTLFPEFSINDKIAEFLAEYGFALENVEILGQKNTDTKSIIKSLNADVGTPIYSINIDNSLEKILDIGWVRQAVIQRKIPNTIIVTLIEKKPLALWQLNKKLYVIDQEGNIIDGADSSRFSKLIHLVGDDANIYAFELIKNINKNQELARRISNAVRYGQRRWDLNFEGNINVKMPEKNFANAYKYLGKLNEEDKLFGKDIKSIDLRDNKKIYIEKF